MHRPRLDALSPPHRPAPKVFRANLFGVAAVNGPDGPVRGKASQRHRLALVALLAVAGKKGLSRERIAAMLWPDAESDKAARRLLSDSIYRVNRALGGDALSASGEAVSIDEQFLSSDVAAFKEAVDAQEWQRVVGLHDGPFLDGFVLNSAPFERWVEEQRRSFRRQRQRALEALAIAEEASDPAKAVTWWRLLATDDPYSSRVALKLMAALERHGERAAAIQHARSHAQLVRDELGLEPDPEIDLFAERLRTVVPPTSQEARFDGRTAKEESEVSRQDELPDSAHARPGADIRPGPIDTEPRNGQLPAGPRRGRIALGLVGIGVAAVTAVLVLGGDPSQDSQLPTETASSVAVLPFSDISPSGDQEYFADGMTDELISRLSRVEGLRVVARTSSFALKGRALDVREIGSELKVDAVLEGSVRRVGDVLRVSAQLVDATDGFELWSESYERRVTDVFAVQDEIARSITSQLTDAPSDAAGPGGAVDPSTDDLEAFNLYLSGRFEWHRRTEPALRQAVELFGDATRRAPEFAQAHAGLGDAYAVLGFYDFLPPEEAFPRAADAARRALELAPDLAEAHATLGYVSLYYDWDPVASERSFRRAIELSPSYSTAHQWYANLLVALARFEDAEREMRVAQGLDPLSRIASGALGFIHYYAGDYQRALAQLALTTQLDPSFDLARLWSGWALEKLGRGDEAVAAFRTAVDLTGSAIARAALARGLAVNGQVAEARDVLEQLEQEAESGYAPAFEIAQVHEALGNRGAAILWLQRGFAERSHSMVFLAIDPQLQGLRGDPEFQRMVSEVAVSQQARERLGW